MSEKSFQAAVIKYAEYLGWRVFHNARADKHLRSQTSVGMPDLVLIHDDYPHDNRMVFAECKAGNYTTTEEQRAWLSLADRVPGCVGVVWREDAPPMQEAHHKVETWEGKDLGAIGRRLRGEDTGTMLKRQEDE